MIESVQDKLVELTNISAGYENEMVFSGVDFLVQNHDFIGIIGPNGGGKTTLVKIILGLLTPVKGDVRYYFGEGSDKTMIGYLPQIHRFDKNFPMLVKDVVLSGLVTRANSGRNFSKESRERAVHLLERMGIPELVNKPVGDLSGGQLQRVLLCRAMISNPRLLILDEPDTYVDNKFENELYRILSELSGSMAIVLISHDLGTISGYVKTFACVNKSIYMHHSNIITRELLEAYNCPIQLVYHDKIPHTVLKHH